MDIKAFLKKEYFGLPTWALGIAAIGGIGLGLYFYRRAKSSVAPEDTTSPDAKSLDTGMGDYVPAGPNAGNMQPTGATINIGVPSTPSNWLTSLVLTSAHPVNLYATSGQPGGLPDAIVSTIPPGTTVQATGPEIVGAWNVPNGSELWYPVTYQGTPGFVSAADVSNANTSINNNPVPPPPVSKVTAKTVTSGWLADKPGGQNPGIGGKNIVNVPKGATVTLESNTPTKNKYGTYYNVTFNGKLGWINAKTIGK